ncbi:hypothetical protein K474DRAFT_1665309 [Panus rudis PR-1116 ss-1]|nr:hypothetical protein K474DRAFT_1670383 [Panus rudis PR-1116 ss-1]KAI0070695.1 hypothetical protein K474DRAFT_1669778 [Panus rudis PR-1116 ss-1]KAI0071278.1 hypothetical protein K474DRAFT_1669180 [Panus rudis PR-1116 ss-1]KAI0074479.1 hypothetical protein K474DRAFT_1665309 [Panus rudis PR-1116 ss-1]
MSGRYNLRRGTLSRAAAHDESNIPGAFSHSDNEHPNAIENTPGRRTYSQVVSSRPPSPDNGPEEPAGSTPASGDTTSSPLTSVDTASAVAVTGSAPEPSVDVLAQHDEEADDNQNNWTTVRRGRRRTLDEELARAASALSDGHLNTLRAAEDGLTPAQRSHYESRMARVSTVSPDRPPSRGEGPSKAKGKTVDPRNWGNSGIPDEDLDPDTQQRELDAYNVQRSLRRSFSPDELDEEEQRLALEHWAAMKAAQHTRPSSPIPDVTMGTPPPSRSSTPSIQEIIPPAFSAPSAARETSVETIAAQLVEIQRELAELRSARSVDSPAVETARRDKAPKPSKAKGKGKGYIH